MTAAALTLLRQCADVETFVHSRDRQWETILDLYQSRMIRIEGHIHRIVPTGYGFEVLRSC